MIKEYTCLPHSLVAAQSLQNLDLEGSQMALRLIITNTLSDTSTYKKKIEINQNSTSNIEKKGKRIKNKFYALQR